MSIVYSNVCQFLQGRLVSLKALHKAVRVTRTRVYIHALTI